MTAETAARVAVRRPSALDFGARRGVVGEPGAQRGPAAAPVVQQFVAAEERAFVGLGGQAQHGVRFLRPGGGFCLGHRRGQPGQVAVKLGHEVGHVGEQGVLVPQERVRRRIGRPDDLAEGQVELGRPARHVVEDRVQPGQPPVNLLRVLGPGRRGERLEVIEDVGEDQPGQVRVPDPRPEHVLHGRERAVAELAELVDRLPVPVPGQASRPRGVLEPVHHAVLGQRVQLFPQAAIQPGHLVVNGAQLGEGSRHVIGVRLDLMHAAQPVQGPQHPQVGHVVIAPGEVEQPEPIADRERVKIQRVPLAAVSAIPGLFCHRLVSYPASSTAADRGQHNAMRGQRRGD